MYLPNPPDFYLYKTPCLSKSKPELPPPEFASWESTLKCNLPCTHCGLNAGCVRKQELNTKESIKMLKALAVFGVKHLVISGGEFTLRPDWLKILRLALQHFTTVRIITNGHLGKKLIPKLNKLKNLDRFILSVSLDGDEFYHDTRRGKGNFNRVMQIIKTPTVYPKVVISTFGQDNFTARQDILHICLANGISSWSVQLSLPAGRMLMSNFLTDKQIQELADFIYRWQKLTNPDLEIIIDDCFGYFHPMRKQKPWRGCQAGIELITILANGIVTTCPTMVDQSAGDIRNQSFEEIWHSSAMEQLRNEKPITCFNCNDCAGGCRAVQTTINRQLCLKPIKGGL